MVPMTRLLGVTDGEIEYTVSRYTLPELIRCLSFYKIAFKTNMGVAQLKQLAITKIKKLAHQERVALSTALSI